MKNFLKWLFGTLIGIVILWSVFAAVQQWNNSRNELSQKRMLFTVDWTTTGTKIMDINTGWKVMVYGPLQDWSGNKYTTWEVDPIYMANSWLYYKSANQSWYIWGSGLSYNTYTLNINWTEPWLILGYTGNISSWSAIVTISGWYTSNCVSQNVVNLTWTIPTNPSPNTTYIISAWSYNITTPITITGSCVYMIWSWNVFLSWWASWTIISRSTYNIFWNLYINWNLGDAIVVTWTNNNAIIAVNVRNAWNWIYLQNSNYITIKDSNILSNTTWILLRTSSNNYFNNIKSFNNTHWIYIRTWYYNTINNSSLFNNSTYWYVVRVWSGNVLSNSETFNNSSNWIRVTASNYLNNIYVLNNVGDTYSATTTWYWYIKTSATSISPNVKYWSANDNYVKSVLWNTWVLSTWVVITWYNSILPYDELWNPLYNVNTGITDWRWKKTFIGFPSSYTIWTWVWLYNPITWVSLNQWLTWLRYFNEFIYSYISFSSLYWDVWSIYKESISKDIIFKNWGVNVLRINTWGIYWIGWSQLVDTNYFITNSYFQWSDYDHISTVSNSVSTFAVNGKMSFGSNWSFNIWSSTNTIQNSNWSIISSASSLLSGWSSSNIFWWKSASVIDSVWSYLYWSIWSIYSSDWSFVSNGIWYITGWYSNIIMGNTTRSETLSRPEWTWTVYYQDPMFRGWRILESANSNVIWNWLISWAYNSYIFWGAWALIGTSWTMLFWDHYYNERMTWYDSNVAMFKFKNWVTINKFTTTSWIALDVSGAIQTNNAFYLTWGSIPGRIIMSGTEIQMQIYSGWNWIKQ